VGVEPTIQDAQTPGRLSAPAVGLKRPHPELVPELPPHPDPLPPMGEREMGWAEIFV